VLTLKRELKPSRRSSDVSRFPRASAGELVDPKLLPDDWKPEPTAFQRMRVMPWGKGGAFSVQMGSTPLRQIHFLSSVTTRTSSSHRSRVLSAPLAKSFPKRDRYAWLPPAAMLIDGASIELWVRFGPRTTLHSCPPIASVHCSEIAATQSLATLLQHAR
jgi:hypothetical protein